MANESKAVKANLRVVLYANDVEIAESVDERLWQTTLAVITGANVPVNAQQAGVQLQSPPQGGIHSLAAIGDLGGAEQFAKEVGTPVDVAQGACGLLREPPYVHLDVHCWEALKRNTPAKGNGSISATKLAATLLVLWFKSAKLGNPTPAQIQAVVDSINLQDKNPSRGIKICEWLQSRNGAVALNPAEASKAIRLARAYCTKSSPQEQT